MDCTKTFLCLFFFPLGWTVGLCVEHFDLFHLIFDVPVFNIINLLVISLGAWYVTYLIQKTNAKNKSKTDLTISTIEEIEAALKRILVLVHQKEPISYIEICSLDKHCRMWANEASSYINKNYPDPILSNRLENTVSLLKELRSKLTNTSICEIEPDVVVKDNNVSYSLKRISEIESTIELYRIDSFYIKMKISQY